MSIDQIKALKDYGMIAALAFAIIWQNSRINEIERRLFDCLDARIHKVDKDPLQPTKLFAILPKEIKIKKK